MYPTSIGTQNMRTKPELLGMNIKDLPSEKVKEVNKTFPMGLPFYSAVLPPMVRCFPEYLREAGYYTTNNEKTDYQFDAPVTVWDECSPAASYKNRPEGKPFFAVFNFFITHESQLGRKDSLLVNPKDVEIPPYYQDTQKSRETMARQLRNIEIMDRQVGELIAQLKQDNVYENSTIFFFSDHGGALPWMKREILERGIHIPLIVRLPKGASAGTTDEQLVSGVDLAPTVLSLCGLEIPAYMQGQAFLGKYKAKKERSYIFAGKDRMDEKYERIRAVRDKRYEYIYNYMPELPGYMDIKYRIEHVPMMKEMLDLRDTGKLNKNAMAWFNAPKQVEELYDLDTDPDQLKNLASDSTYSKKLIELRTAFRKWEANVGDLAAIPEAEMIKNWWNGQNSPPITAKPQIIEQNDGVKISCTTPGSSIGYRIIKAGEKQDKNLSIVKTWDLRLINNMVSNGDKISTSPSWQVYVGKKIKLNAGDTLIVNAMRIGYEPTEINYAKK